MPRLFGDTVLKAVDADDEPISGAKLIVYEAGTTTSVSTYSDAALSTVQSSPLVANSAGVFASVYVPAGEYKADMTDPDGVSLPGYPVDNIYVGFGGDDPLVRDFPNRTAAIAATIPAVVDAVRVAGYTTAGDGGGAFYTRVDNNPSHNGKFQSADGAFWELVERAVSPMMFGASSDESVDSADAIEDAFGFLAAYPGSQMILERPYGIASKIVVTGTGLSVRGQGRWDAGFKTISGANSYIQISENGAPGSSRGFHITFESVLFAGNTLADHCAYVGYQSQSAMFVNCRFEGARKTGVFNDFNATGTKLADCLIQRIGDGASGVITSVGHGVETRSNIQLDSTYIAAVTGYDVFLKTDDANPYEPGTTVEECHMTMVAGRLGACYAGMALVDTTDGCGTNNTGVARLTLRDVYMENPGVVPLPDGSDATTANVGAMVESRGVRSFINAMGGPKWQMRKSLYALLSTQGGQIDVEGPITCIAQVDGAEIARATFAKTIQNGSTAGRIRIHRWPGVFQSTGSAVTSPDDLTMDPAWVSYLSSAPHPSRPGIDVPGRRLVATPLDGTTVSLPDWFVSAGSAATNGSVFQTESSSILLTADGSTAAPCGVTFTWPIPPELIRRKLMAVAVYRMERDGSDWGHSGGSDPNPRIRVRDASAGGRMSPEDVTSSVSDAIADPGAGNNTGWLYSCTAFEARIAADLTFTVNFSTRTLALDGLLYLDRVEIWEVGS